MNALILCGENTCDIQQIQTSLPDVKLTTIAHEDISVQRLEAYFNGCDSSHVLLIDMITDKVKLKQSALSLYELIAQVSEDWSMIYADYEVDTEGEIIEEHLLEHHIGRVRDSVDYGRVWYINTDKVREALPLSDSTKQHFLYELRLRLSEVGELVHVANRYAGAPYTVFKTPDEQNVFDYLLQSKASQLELERIATDHLKRIKAFLPAGASINEVPYHQKSYDLLASIIIPVNNRPEFIGSAIESVLKQSIQNIEVIVVVNGGEDDPTISVVRTYMKGGSNFDPSRPEVRLIIHDINNIGFCLNSGLKAARGKFYVQLDSDDQLTSDAVEKILAVYEADKTVGLVIGSYEVWEKDEKSGDVHRMTSIPVVKHDEWTDENGRNNLLRINGAGAPRSFYVELARDLGYLDMNTSAYARNYGEDYDFVLRMSEQYRIGRVWDPVYKVIRHGGGTDHNIDKHTIDRNNNAKDEMRRLTILRRQKMNESLNG